MCVCGGGGGRGGRSSSCMSLFDSTNSQQVGLSRHQNMLAPACVPSLSC